MMGSAKGGGIISIEGSSAIVERGLVWSTSPGPTLTSSGKVSSTTGSNTFELSITGLIPNTLYYVRAYATNGELTGYGNEVSFTTLDGIIDIDGNVYPKVTIGTQTWMAENLKVSKYRNGDPLPTGLSNDQWKILTNGAYAVYENNESNNNTYGKLYNGYAVVDTRNLCPTGWHVPSSGEWNTLINFLGGSNVAGGKLKSITGWDSPNTGATNESGFSGLPGGARMNEGIYLNNRQVGLWWSTDTQILFLNKDQSNAEFWPAIKEAGISVRCLKD